MKNLKTLRENAGLTREELAVKLGLSGRYIAFIEDGERTPSLNTAKSIANYFNVTVDEIFLNTKCTNSTLNKKDDETNE